MSRYSGFLCALIVAAAAAVMPGAASAQGYPQRPVTIIVPFAAGGGTDVVARAMAPAFAAKLGQSLVIENITGAAGAIAAARVARAAPDGYTLIMHNLAMALSSALYTKLSYDAEKDFVPIAMINQTPTVFVGRKGIPANNIAELVAWMKKNRARLVHPGVGSTGHIQVALLAKMIGAEADYIPYRGAGPMLQDIIAGHVDMGTVTLGNAVAPVTGGLVKGFGVSARQPAKLLPQVPSMTEVGPEMEVLFWNVLLAPAGTPKDIIAKLHAAFEETVKDQTLVEGWAKLGIDLYPAAQRTPEGTREYMRSEFASWKKRISDAKIEVQQP